MMGEREMKVLIAITCCAVLAAVALFFLQAYRNSVAETAAAAQAEAESLVEDCWGLQDSSNLTLARAELRDKMRARCTAIGIKF